MRRFNIIIATTALILGACAGDEGDDSASTSATTSTATPTEGAAPSSTDDTDAPTDDAATDETETAETAEASTEAATESDTAGTESDADTDDTDTDDTDTVVVGSLSDMPSECIDLFREFLVEIEPIVEPIDWDRATFAELDRLGAEFDELGADFQAGTEQLGCDRFDLASEDAGIDEMIEFARTEAPGTIGFFEFIEGFQDFGDAVDGDVEAADAPETCDDAIGAIEDLMDEYGQMTDVPASELLTITNVLSSLPTVCSVPEIESVLARDDIQAFLDG